MHEVSCFLVCIAACNCGFIDGSAVTTMLYVQFYITVSVAVDYVLSEINPASALVARLPASASIMCLMVMARLMISCVW